MVGHHGNKENATELDGIPLVFKSSKKFCACLSQKHYAEVQSKQPCPGFELRLSGPFLTMITITPCKWDSNSYVGM